MMKKIMMSLSDSYGCIDSKREIQRKNETGNEARNKY